ncbi:hypothetical protein EVAR_99607_1 [Eumeta japonica]|uniref:Uncharacterized protein n=1 Tax=Eumeta variegata TaxID=151549 RepID=A0A4C1SVN9_EUMVA|nr:hypothetical protein EVAR_99607_1 [Eumeta japonica]
MGGTHFIVTGRLHCGGTRSLFVFTLGPTTRASCALVFSAADATATPVSTGGDDTMNQTTNSDHRTTHSSHISIVAVPRSASSNSSCTAYIAAGTTGRQWCH